MRAGGAPARAWVAREAGRRWSRGQTHARPHRQHLIPLLQQPVAEGGRRYSGFFDVLRHRLQTHGVGGWYKGLPIWLCGAASMVAQPMAERVIASPPRRGTRRAAFPPASGRL